MEALEAELRRRFDVVEERVEVAGRTLKLLMPRNADALIDEEAFARDERLPYWAEVWASARGLAGWVVGERQNSRPTDQQIGRRARVLEVGCGLGLPSLVLAAAGVAVTASDYYAEALEFVRVNAWRNGIAEPATITLDWRAVPGDLEPFDVVLAADVLYEERQARELAAALPRLVKEGGRAVVADPGRRYRPVLEAELRSIGWDVREVARHEVRNERAAASTVSIVTGTRPPTQLSA